MRGGVFKTVVCNLSVNSLFLLYNSITNALYPFICKLQKLPTYSASAYQFTNLLKSYVSQSGVILGPLHVRL